jgi:hypothetical protein
MRGLCFDELERIVNLRNAQVRASANMKTGKQAKTKNKAVFIERRV